MMVQIFRVQVSGETIANQLCGAMIGVITSIVNSWWFFKKADLPARILDDWTDSILLFLIQDRLGHDFQGELVVSRESLPTDKDVPHILRFYLSASEMMGGDTIKTLYRVSDKGQNFRGNLEVTEQSPQVRVLVERKGHGYYYSNVTFQKEHIPGLYRIRFQLTISKGKINMQLLEINVR